MSEGPHHDLLSAPWPLSPAYPAHLIDHTPDRALPRIWATSYLLSELSGHSEVSVHGHMPVYWNDGKLTESLQLSGSAFQNSDVGGNYRCVVWVWVFADASVPLALTDPAIFGVRHRVSREFWGEGAPIPNQRRTAYMKSKATPTKQITRSANILNWTRPTLGGEERKKEKPWLTLGSEPRHLASDGVSGTRSEKKNKKSPWTVTLELFFPFHAELLARNPETWEKRTLDDAGSRRVTLTRPTVRRPRPCLGYGIGAGKTRFHDISSGAFPCG
ncbi:hypothetical protein PGQ11_004583 [Apiospora arundinis]|uniref:Uncharacterized protein n=1 Tax=Apiospora arundinis TaxID=335852 RepID=A0ABR2J8D7_9PEZI